jgi:hypothetical protein
MKLNVPFWYHFEIGWRQLYWIEMFLSAKYYVGRTPEIPVEGGTLIFYKDGTVHFIAKEI